MKTLSRLLLPIFLGCLFVSAQASPAVVGKWVGKITLNSASLPKNLNPQQAEQLKKSIAELKKTVIHLNVLADNTYNSNVSAFGQKHTQSGTWRLSGSKMVLLPKLEDNKPVKRDAQTLDISKDGKTMTFLVPNGAGSRATFTRG